MHSSPPLIFDPRSIDNGKQARRTGLGYEQISVSGNPAALDILERDPDRRRRLHRLIDIVNDGIGRLAGLKGSGSQIVPVIVGQDRLALALADAMQNRGFDIRAIRPPTVPEGTARLRLSVTLNVCEDDIQALLSAPDEEWERLRV